MDDGPALAKVKVPVLALNGALDLQVDPEQNLPTEWILKRFGPKTGADGERPDTPTLRRSGIADGA